MEQKAIHESYPASDPAIVAMDLSKSLQDMKKNTIQKVLKLINDKKPKLNDAYIQTETSKADALITLEKQYLKEQRELKSQISLLENEISQNKQEHLRQLKEMRMLLKCELENSDEISQVFDNVKTQSNELSKKPDLKPDDIENIKNIVLYFHFSISDY